MLRLAVMMLVLATLGGCYVGVGGHGGGVVHATQPTSLARGSVATPALTGNGVGFSVGIAVQPKPTELVAAGVIVQSAAGEAAGGFLLRGEQALDSRRPWLRAYTQLSVAGHKCPDKHPSDCVDRSDEVSVTSVGAGIATTATDGHHFAGAALGATYMHIADSQFGSADAIGLQLSLVASVHPAELLWSMYKHPPRGTN